LRSWGKRCSGFIAFSDETDPSINALHLESYGPEHYQNIWQKVQAIWTFIHDNLMIDSSSVQTVSESAGRPIHNYDWFFIAGDDVYLIVENIHLFLRKTLMKHLNTSMSADSINADIPFYLGRPLRQSFNLLYNSGGAGYLLNAAALKLLVAALKDNLLRYDLTNTDNEDGNIIHNLCFHGTNTSIEDVMVGYCMSQLNISLWDTKDENGRERFHWHSPHAEFDGSLSDYLFQSSKSSKGLPVKTGMDCCSPESISFHNMDDLYIECIHSHLYNY
jgi:glycoprotein-N-acetylgalactosamine 3-beta-galactosyltransferase